MLGQRERDEEAERPKQDIAAKVDEEYKKLEKDLARSVSELGQVLQWIQ